MNNRSQVNSSRGIRSIFCILLGIFVFGMPAHAATWTFDFHGNPLGYSVNLKDGKVFSFQLCATPEVVKVVKPWPGAKITVDIAWKRKGHQVTYHPWVGVSSGLPQQSKMIQVSDGRYCSIVHIVKYESFPKKGGWEMRAKIRNSSVGFLLTRWSVKPPLLKPVTGPAFIKKGSSLPKPGSSARRLKRPLVSKPASVPALKMFKLKQPVKK